MSGILKIANKLLINDRPKFAALLVGITFAVFPMIEMTSLFAGILSRSSSTVINIGASIWVMDPAVQTVVNTIPLPDYVLDEAKPMIRSVTGILEFMAPALTPFAVSSPGEDLVSQAQAAIPDLHNGMLLYLQHCAACHDRQAWGDGPREIPVLAGQRESYLIQQLVHFVSGARQGSEMHGPVMHDTLQPSDVDRAQALRDLAAYLTSAPRNPQPEYGDGVALKVGEREYARGCTGCHRSDGAGRDRGAIPAIGGQGYSYLLSQLRSFAAGHLAHPAVADSPVALSAEEQPAVADYVSRLTYLTAGAH